MNPIKERQADPNDPAFLTPIGRIVSGNLWEPRTTDYQGNPLTVKTGVNAGETRQDYSFGIAILKSDPGLQLLFTKMMNEAKRGFPRLFDANGRCTYPGFAFKFQDGDSDQPNRNGVKPCDRQGWRGCYVFFFSGSIPTKVVGADATPITDKEAVKPGFFVRVSGSFRENGNQQNPGIYVNHNFVQYIAYGEPIVFGPSAEEAFAAPIGALPPGASTVPLAPPTVPIPTVPGAAAPVSPYGPAASIPPTTTGPTLPQAPATGWLNPTPPAAPAPAPAAPAAPPAERKYLYGGVVYPESVLRASGHTDEHLATYAVA